MDERVTTGGGAVGGAIVGASLGASFGPPGVVAEIGFGAIAGDMLEELAATGTLHP